MSVFGARGVVVCWAGHPVGMWLTACLLLLCVQVDSGYNTYSAGTTSLMEGISCDSQSKEALDAHIPEEGPQLYTKLLKSKVKEGEGVGCTCILS